MQGTSNSVVDNTVAHTEHRSASRQHAASAVIRRRWSVRSVRLPNGTRVIVRPIGGRDARANHAQRFVAIVSAGNAPVRQALARAGAPAHTIGGDIQYLLDFDALRRALNLSSIDNSRQPHASARSLTLAA